MAGGEEHVSELKFYGFKPNALYSPIMPNCQQIRFVELSFHVFHNFWKLEWQDFVTSSQLLCFFIEEKINAIQLVSALVNVLVQTVLLSFFFFSFYFLNALQSGINGSLAAWAKISLSRAQNIFMPENVNSIVISPYLFVTAV